MSNKTIEAILKLSSKLGSMTAFGQLSAKLAAVDKQAKKFNKTQGLMARGANAAFLATSRLIAPAAVAYGAARAVKSYAALERQIGRIGITADASAAETRAAMEAVQAAAQQYALPIDEAVAGLDSLVASGKSLKEAMAFLPSVLSTAQASGSAVADIATTADAMSSSLGISADRMTAAFDILAAAGKAGKFELKDMAAELPSLAPAFAALGYKGEAGLKKLAAAAQMVRVQTGSSSEAATNLMNVFQKMEASQTASNFAKFGVDLRKEMAKARKEGKDVLDTFIRLSEVATKGDLSKLPQLFTDMQMLQGMRALMTGAEGMERLVAALGKADGTVLEDLNRVLADTESKVQKLTNSWTKFWSAAGGELVDAGAADFLDRVVDKSEASKKALDARGVKGGLAQMWWQMNATEAERNGVLWEGGYRSPGDKAAIAAYAANAKAAAGAPHMQPGPENLPSLGPIPAMRPAHVPGGRRIRGGRGYGADQVQIRMGGDAAPMSREQAAAARAQVMDAGGWANEADKVAQAMRSGGDQAGQAVKGAGEAAGQSMADAILSAGSTVAAQIGAAIAAGAAKAKAANQPIRANTGQSGPGIEGMP